jgi:hypothetical protein
VIGLAAVLVAAVIGLVADATGPADVIGGPPSWRRRANDEDPC